MKIFYKLGALAALALVGCVDTSASEEKEIAQDARFTPPIEVSVHEIPIEFRMTHGQWVDGPGSASDRFKLLKKGTNIVLDDKYVCTADMLILANIEGKTVVLMPQSFKGVCVAGGLGEPNSKVGTEAVREAVEETHIGLPAATPENSKFAGFPNTSSRFDPNENQQHIGVMFLEGMTLAQFNRARDSVVQANKEFKSSGNARPKPHQESEDLFAITLESLLALCQTVSGWTLEQINDDKWLEKNQIHTLSVLNPKTGKFENKELAMRDDFLKFISPQKRGDNNLGSFLKKHVAPIAAKLYAPKQDAK